MKKERLYQLVFFASVLGMSVLYDYPSELFRRPHGYHNWRQCDGATITLNYYNVSMNFFEPRLNLIENNDGKMVSEFPVIYYLTACLYKVFGFHEFFLRLISALIFFSGLYYLFKTISLLLDDSWYGLVLSLMLFTSPLVIDYALNFLPDVPGLALSFIGFYFFVVYLQNQNNKSLYISTFWFALAGLLKITALIGFLSLAGTIIFVALFYFFKSEKPVCLRNKTALTLFILLPLVVNVCWIAYVNYYNTTNNNLYFTTSIRPIWNVGEAKTKEIWAQFDYQWLRMTMYRDFLNTIPFLAGIALLFYSRKNVPYALWMLFCIIGSVLYVILFFEQFIVHDYYMICLSILPVSVIFVLLKRIKEWKFSVFNSYFFKVGLAVLLGVMVHHGYRINSMREKMDYYTFPEYFSADKELLKFGIAPDDKVISIGDESTGITLYLMNRRGWTQYGMANPVPKSQIESCVQKGASHLLVYKDSDSQLSEEVKKEFLQNLVGTLPGVRIYKLNNI